MVRRAGPCGHHLTLRYRDLLGRDTLAITPIDSATARDTASLKASGMRQRVVYDVMNRVRRTETIGPARTYASNYNQTFTPAPTPEQRLIVETEYDAQEQSGVPTMSSHADRSYRLGLAIRRQRGRMLAERVLETLSAALGVALSDHDFSTLEQSDQLLEAYSRAFAECGVGKRRHMHLRISSREAPALFLHMQHVSPSLGPRLVLFGRDFECTGAIQMPATAFFATAESLLLLEVDELRAASLDGEQGLLIDNVEREAAIEFWCWGDKWIAAAQRAGLQEVSQS